jgi:hypothetical protein
MKTVAKIVRSSLIAMSLASVLAAAPAAAANLYLNTSSSQTRSTLSNAGVVSGRANYNDYHGLNGGSVCELPIYNSWGNVTGFRQGNC